MSTWPIRFAGEEMVALDQERRRNTEAVSLPRSVFEKLHDLALNHMEKVHAVESDRLSTTYELDIRKLTDLLLRVYAGEDPIRVCHDLNVGGSILAEQLMREYEGKCIIRRELTLTMPTDPMVRNHRVVEVRAEANLLNAYANYLEVEWNRS